MSGSSLEKLWEAVNQYLPCEGPHRGQELIQIRRIVDLLELKASVVADSFEKSDEWDRHGDASPIQWMRSNCHMMSSAAARSICVGNELDRLPGAKQALMQGEIGFAHLSLIAYTAESIGEQFCETLLVEKAKDESVTRFRRTCEHFRHANDPRSVVEDEERAHEARFLELSPQDNGGVWLRGWLDPEGASVVRSTLEPLARPAARADERSRAQRLADALVEALGHNQETELVVSVPAETLLGLTGASSAETEWGTLLSAAAVERHACAAAFRRMVVDENSVVIDLGRRHRLVSPRARKALGARDSHCVWPGCDRPARWCEAHHRLPWSHGGGTEVNGLVLICRRHHRRVHEAGWQLVPDEAGGYRAIPPISPSWQVDLPAA